MHVRQLTQVVFFISAITAILVLCNPLIGSAQKLRAIDVVPDEEKRSSIHEVDGYAYLSENMTISDLRAIRCAPGRSHGTECAADRQGVERPKGLSQGRIYHALCTGQPGFPCPYRGCGGG